MEARYQHCFEASEKLTGILTVTKELSERDSAKSGTLKRKESEQGSGSASREHSMLCAELDEVSNQENHIRGQDKQHHSIQFIGTTTGMVGPESDVQDTHNATLVEGLAIQSTTVRRGD